MTAAVGPTRRELLAAAAVLSVPFAVGCGGDEPDALDRMREAGFVRLGIVDEPPFGYARPGGEVTGYAVEVARAAFEALGVPRVVGVVTEFELLIDGVRAGAFDVIAAGMYVLPERCRRAAFTAPIFQAPQALAVRRGNPLGLESYRDVAASRQARLGVLAGTAEAAEAPQAGVPQDRVLTFPSRQALRDALDGRVVDAVALTTISVRRLIATAARPERLAMSPPFTPMIDGRPRPRAGALALRPGDDRVRRGLDAQIARLHRSGELVRIGRRFGLTAEEVRSARQVEAADLCRAPR